MTAFTPLFINGASTAASDGGTFEVRNSYTGKVVGTAASATSADCKAAIEAAGKALRKWEETRPTDRGRIFQKAIDLLQTDEYKQKIQQAVREEISAAEDWSYFSWVASINTLRGAVNMVAQLKGDMYLSEAVPGATVFTQRRPMGVIFAIGPWNAPVTLALRAVAAPIICGNTVVFKGSEFSPSSQAIAVEVLAEAGLPPGVVNFISVSRENAPVLTAEIIGHPLVRKINFTGSDRVGRIIATEAAKYLKPCVLELGGKAPTIVLDDADLTEAAKAIVHGALTFSGQVCMSTERVIAQSGIAQDLLSRIRELCEKMKAGDPSDPAVKFSALFTEMSAENVVGMMREAQGQGANVLFGDLQRQGALVTPHVVTDVRPGMRLWDRESFGPVITFAVAQTVDEAVELANASEYSLTASLWSKDRFAALEIAPRIRSGYVNINGPTLHSEPGIGLIGLGGASGYGRFDVEAFTDKRAFIVHSSGRKYPFLN